MRWPSILVVVAVAVGLTAAIGVPRAHACSCIELQPSHLDNMAGAASGVVVERIGPDDEYAVTVDVDRDLHGNLGERIEVVTHADDTACGVDLQVGDRFTQAMRLDDDGWLTTDGCESVPESLFSEWVPPSPSSGDAVALLGRRGDRYRLAAVDSGGAIVARGWAAGRTHGMSLCDDGRHLFELSRGWTETGVHTWFVTKWSVDDLVPIETWPVTERFDGDFDAIACVDGSTDRATLRGLEYFEGGWDDVRDEVAFGFEAGAVEEIPLEHLGAIDSFQPDDNRFIEIRGSEVRAPFWVWQVLELPEAREIAEGPAPQQLPFIPVDFVPPREIGTAAVAAQWGLLALLGATALAYRRRRRHQSP